MPIQIATFTEANDISAPNDGALSKICRESSNGIDNLPRKNGSNRGNIKKSRYSKLKQLFLVTMNKSLTLYQLLNG